MRCECSGVEEGPEQCNHWPYKCTKKAKTLSHPNLYDEDDPSYMSLAEPSCFGCRRRWEVWKTYKIEQYKKENKRVKRQEALRLKRWKEQGRCVAITRNGSQCTLLPAMPGQAFCVTHGGNKPDGRGPCYEKVPESVGVTNFDFSYAVGTRLPKMTSFSDMEEIYSDFHIWIVRRKGNKDVIQQH